VDTIGPNHITKRSLKGASEQSVKNQCNRALLGTIASCDHVTIGKALPH